MWQVLLLLPLLVQSTVLFRGSIGSSTEVLFEEAARHKRGAVCRDDNAYCADWAIKGSCQTNPDYMRTTCRKSCEICQGGGTSGRPGSASRTHSCGYVRKVPNKLRSWTEMYPSGLTDQFYQKYTEAYGIPVVSSSRVPDEALQRACYVLRFLLADHPGIRDNYYRRYGRVGVMATTEYTTNIPEHSWLDPVFWDARARGLGATEAHPISTGGEENILCYERDAYSNEDIFLHEFAHGVHLLGAKYAIPGWDASLSYWYQARKVAGLWANTYSMSTVDEYFAEGVQSWFGVNEYARPANGVHGPISTKSALESYDPELYNLISLVFPCGNTFIKRCEKSRAREAAQVLEMDCVDTCRDLSGSCGEWVASGYCSAGEYRRYMSANCRYSCGLCGTVCRDDNGYCADWARKGSCQTNPDYMRINCKKSCNVC